MKRVEELRVVIIPSPIAARVLAFEGYRLVLSADLPSIPWHRRALPRFLKALADWHPLPVRAVLVVDEGEHGFVSELVSRLRRPRLRARDRGPPSVG
jgi:hypothetical protein